MAAAGAVQTYPTYPQALAALGTVGAQFHSYQGQTQLWWSAQAGRWYRLSQTPRGFRVEPVGPAKDCGC